MIIYLDFNQTKLKMKTRHTIFNVNVEANIPNNQKLQKYKKILMHMQDFSFNYLTTVKLGHSIKIISGLSYLSTLSIPDRVAKTYID